MKMGKNLVIISMALGLAACQATAPTGVLSQGDISRNQTAVLALVADKPDQANVYFSAHGQYMNSPVAGGYYRQVLGKTAAGGWVVQDFYQDSQTKQIDPAVVFHPDGLRNFDNDVVDGAVVWYRPDGSLMQSATYDKGKLTGWLTYYDEQSRGRLSLNMINGSPNGEQLAYDEQGRLTMRISINEQNQLQQEFWYGNGKSAAVWRESGLTAWNEHGQKLSEVQAERLVAYLESLLYQPDQ